MMREGAGNIPAQFGNGLLTVFLDWQQMEKIKSKGKSSHIRRYNPFNLPLGKSLDSDHLK